jgi:NitT/TauT family transport system permease protein/taurine transport system permease protein
MRRPSPATVRRLTLALVLALWELVPRTGLLPELFLPALSKTLAALVQNWGEYAHARPCGSCRRARPAW